MKRIMTGGILGGIGAIVVATQWPDPNNGYLGALLGYMGSITGLIAGMWWEDRRWK